MRAAINCSLANRQILGHYARRVSQYFFPACDSRLLFDVSHNMCKVEMHVADGKRRELFVHRKGATRTSAQAMRAFQKLLDPLASPC
jgi:tRNA-splicing ligase RtcB